MKKKMEREGLRGGGGLGRSDSPHPKSRHHKAIAEKRGASQAINGPKDGRDPPSRLMYT